MKLIEDFIHLLRTIPNMPIILFIVISLISKMGINEFVSRDVEDVFTPELSKAIGDAYPDWLYDLIAIAFYIWLTIFFTR